MRLPVDKPYRDGAGFGAWLWYGRHRGKDFLPYRRGRHQRVFAPEDGRVTRYVGGACHGLDIKGESGITHRLCHLNDRYALVGENVKEGKIVGTMGNKGLSRGVHLHWAAIKNGRVVNPLSLLKDDKMQVKDLFKKIWRRQPATGELLTFYYRWRYGGKSMDWVKNNMKYWYGVVYPGGKLDKKGDAKWQRHKAKTLRRYA